MARHKHILIQDPGEARPYTSISSGRSREFKTPPRDRRVHARKLLADIDQACQDAQDIAERNGHVIGDFCLEIIGDDAQQYDLKIESLEDRSLRVELLSTHLHDGHLHATVYVPEGQLEKYVRKIERYRDENVGDSDSPKNKALVEGISEIRFPVLRSFWTDDDNLYPTSEQETIWWEVWVRVGPAETPDAAFAAFLAVTAGSQLQVSQQVIKFPERLVFLVFGSPAQWTDVFVPLLDRLAELRLAKDIPTEFLSLDATDQRLFVHDLAKRLVMPPSNAPAVCLLDFGVHTAHPLLSLLLPDEDAHTYDPSWPIVDHAESHGTEMAGLAAFGDDLPPLLTSHANHTLVHRLESVRMFHSDRPHQNRAAWGYITQASLARAEIQAPNRSRVACLAVTAQDCGRDNGRPTSWSAAIDDHSSGRLDDHRRLYVISAGNVRDLSTNQSYFYPDTNLSSHGIEDPGQSWNALTVGAFTDRVHIRSTDFDGYQPVAPPGGLCPTSRTSHAWGDDAWPLKPDIVMEGGNYARSPEGRIDACDDLSLLTTSLDTTGRLLTCIADTSAATAQAARFAAILMADYPALWPETVRGLLVHSAEWTDEMQRQISGANQRARHRRLRCFGYGVPNLERARYTVENCVSLVHQGTIQPFKLDGSDTKTNHFMLHSLPWPKAALEVLHQHDVTVRITLSYFIEPSPSGRGWGKKFRYASHGLRFALLGPVETERDFLQRISHQEWDKGQTQAATSDPIDWEIGSRLRTRGSIHSDWWTASAVDVAASGQIAVFPVTGWWRERKHLDCVEKETRYALIITISTPATEVDLYTPIAQQVGLTTEINT